MMNDFDNSLLKAYLNDIGNKDLLTDEQERELARKAQSGDEDARRQLVSSNLKFVVSMAKQYARQGLAVEDLISEGNIGLLTAIDKFEPEKGYHFISYAVWWIRQAILKAIGEKSRMIRLPMNKSADLIQILQAKSNLEKNGYDDASIEAIAAECGMDAQDVLEIMQIARDVSSLDAPVNSEEDTSFGDFLESDEPRPEEVVMDEALKNSVRKILGTLSEKERGIITLRFGLDNNKALSLKEVGEIYNLTKERIRQIEKKVLSNLLENEEVRELKAYIA